MEENLNSLGGLVHSQQILLALTQKGASREDAYHLVQKYAMDVWEKGGNYLDKMREYTLITSKDDPDINTMIVNNFANSMGLYSPENKLVLLKINGVEIGLFTLFEHYEKEWFERKMNLTNYVSFKSNDDVYMTKFGCCFKCYVQWVEDREERWKTGWRPER